MKKVKINGIVHAKHIARRVVYLGSVNSVITGCLISCVIGGQLSGYLVGKETTEDVDCMMCIAHLASYENYT